MKDTDHLKKALEQLDRQLDTWPGPCQECKFFKRDFLFLEDSRCLAPTEVATNFHTAFGFNHLQSLAKSVRHQHGDCGPEGHLFQPKWWVSIRNYIFGNPHRSE
jgi:hypothetical protein